MPIKLAILFTVALLLSGCEVRFVGGAKPYWGIAGFVPANFPNYNQESFVSMWQELNANTEIYGVHTDWQELSLVAQAQNQYSGSLVVVLGWQDPAEWKAGATSLITQVLDLVAANTKIKYLGIGNEINLLRAQNPTDFKNYITGYKQLYQEVKTKFPMLSIFPTFQYEALIGKGYLSGGHNESWDLLKELDDYLDLVVLTTYPYFDYKLPTDIPANYFAEATKYSVKPLAVSETGWMSRQSFGGKFSSLSEQGYAGSEQEQVDYLRKLREILPKDNTEFVNWAFLHDISKWQEGDEPSLHPLFDSIALKNNDGSSKLVWEEWQNLP